MPRGDGTGPRGMGPGTGRGMGRRGSGQNSGRLGRMGGTRAGAGPGGNCVCPSCGTTIPHQAGVPCFQHKCPNCGTNMVRA
ncbi:TPA: hypothetical protein ENX78_18870 [Candidatus Poribacteria bacterium]|nr:hypothetical protein [Candidatus Poribacteria bacterium]